MPPGPAARQFRRNATRGGRSWSYGLGDAMARVLAGAGLRGQLAVMGAKSWRYRVLVPLGMIVLLVASAVEMGKVLAWYAEETEVSMESVSVASPGSEVVRAQHAEVHPHFHLSRSSVHSTCLTEYGIDLFSLESIQAYELSLARVEDNMDFMNERNHVTLRRKVACLFHALLAYRAENRGDVDAVHGLLDRAVWISLRYFSQYFDLAKKKQLIYFHHISKSGGSGMCSQAWLNGCRSAGPPLGDAQGLEPVGNFEGKEYTDGGNCWSRKFEDKFTWFGEKSVRSKNGDFSCKKRLQLAKKAGYNFMANEGYLTEGEEERPCSKDVLSVEILREPVKRAISHLAHMISEGYFHDADSHTCITPKVLATIEHKHYRNHVEYRDVNMTCYAEKHFVSASNYATRSLAGRDAFVRPVDGLTDEDLQQAKKALKQFDTLIVLNKKAFAHDVSHSSIYKLMLGFHINNEVKHFVNKRDYDLNLSTQQKDWIAALNTYDEALYSLGLDLFELDVLLYNRTTELCHAWEKKAVNLPSSMDQYRSACYVFNHREIVAKTHFKTSLGRRVSLNETFACGCGWAGSTNKNRNVPSWMAIANRLPAEQDCPRTSLFPNPTVV
mmetsp:Transcript_16378/g.40371  ORF Transcript_16378/g.40371 Transcript_16378/m.40371 type:complete len:611 (+) Transcript_16378:94-1926(+)|eukprot:CAMPEP_0198313552 /NCGR_PEP_ID=MMETSP1450-20131203/4533_1 /TAXON_ID=753684 ORGANISM="Madagascaria erythrocladiodes, Strain CCMP3234" /NCGR_SAMPLE_ID=MMETSP1450 /ASSEMBLY_ACC=CAM_ASM_001115 /LENGTH=610 /DNA_ID=CAMNT_0044016561 /DNA_START=94 /DNA_END=1926 /DNA_ORIENTATION=-